MSPEPTTLVGRKGEAILAAGRVVSLLRALENPGVPGEGVMDASYTEKVVHTAELAFTV